MIQYTTNAGCRLAYTVEGSGPPVLFIQGVGLPGVGWLPQTDVLRNSYRCVYFDNRGTGQSDSKLELLSVEQLADDCVAILDANRWSSAHIVGHSLGGMIALQLALKAPGRVRSLSLLCSFANGREVAPLTWRMMKLGLGTKIGTRRMRRKAFLGLIMSPAGLAAADADELARQMAPLFGRDLADEPPIVSRQLAALRKFNALPRLHELRDVPTLVVSARHDPIAPPALGKRMTEQICGARYIEMADASHGAPIEMASRMNDYLVEHLARAESGSKHRVLSAEREA